MAAALSKKPFLLPGSADHAVLLVHGLGGGPYELQRLGEALAHRHGLTTQALCLPGHDTLSRRMPRSGWRDWYAAVRQAHAELGQRFRRVDLVGFSAGCLSVLRLAEEGEVRGRLVLLAPLVRIFRPPWLPFLPEELLARFSVLSSVPRRRPPLRDRERSRELARAGAFWTFSLDATRSALELSRDVMAHLASVEVPTLVIQGRQDSVVDPKGAEEVHAGLGGEKRLVWIEGSDHLLTMDVGSETVAREVEAFLLSTDRVSV